MPDDDLIAYEKIRMEACKGDTLKDAAILAEGRKAALKLDGYRTIRYTASELTFWRKVSGTPGSPVFEDECEADERTVVLVMGKPKQ